MVDLRTRAVQVCFEAGRFYRIRQSQLSENLYAGTGQVFGGVVKLSAGSLQWRAAGRDCRDCTLCKKLRTEDYFN